MQNWDHIYLTTQWFNFWIYSLKKTLDIYPKKKNNNNSTCSQGTYTNDVFCSVVEIANIWKWLQCPFNIQWRSSSCTAHIFFIFKTFWLSELIPAPLRPQLNIPFTNIVNLNPNPSEQIFWKNTNVTNQIENYKTSLLKPFQ